MADARVTATRSKEEELGGEKVFKSVKDALDAVARGEPCLHLDLSRQFTEDALGRKVAITTITQQTLTELVDALPRLTQLKTLLLACKTELPIAKQQQIMLQMSVSPMHC